MALIKSKTENALKDDEEPSSDCLIIILNVLSTFLLLAVALKSKLTVVSPDTLFGSPEITPVELLSDNPAPDKFVALISL